MIEVSHVNAMELCRARHIKDDPGSLLCLNSKLGGNHERIFQYIYFDFHFSNWNMNAAKCTN